MKKSEMVNHGTYKVTVYGESYKRCVYSPKNDCHKFFCKHYGEWIEVYRSWDDYTNKKPNF